MRTPSRRRRATIVSANLVASRRPHRQSTTPQNILRVLSRALLRGRDDDVQPSDQEIPEPDVRSPPVTIDNAEQLDPAFDFPDDGPDEDFYRPSTAGDTDGDHYFDARLNQPTSSLIPEDIDTRRDLTSDLIPRSTMFSDIAFPEGIMPDQHDIEEEQEHEQEDREEEEEQPIDPFLSDDERLHTERLAPLTAPHTQTRTKRQRVQTIKTSNSQNPLTSKSILEFAQFCTRKQIPKECTSVLAEISGEFFDNVARDLDAYADHARSRKVINARDAFLLLKRQRHVSDLESLMSLANNMLPLEDVMELKKNLDKLN